MFTTLPLDLPTFKFKLFNISHLLEVVLTWRRKIIGMDPDSNEKWGGTGRKLQFSIGLTLLWSRVIWIWTCCFPVKNLFPFPLATALLIGDVMMNRQSVVKLFLSVITGSILLAHLIDFLIRRCYVTPKYSNTHPANLFRHAYSK